MDSIRGKTVSIRSGLIAGCVATFVISAIVQMKNATGKLADVQLIKAWSAMLGNPTSLAPGWIAHIIVGFIVGGIVFALLNSRLPTRSYAIKGAVFGVLAWLLMMLVVMPLGGAGVFAMQQGALAPAAILILYLIYGLVLGPLYKSGIDPA